MGSFKASFEEKGDVVIIRLSGTLWGSPDWEKILYAPLNEHLKTGARSYVVSLEKVKLIASIGVGYINTIYVSVTNRGGRIALCGMNKRVLNVFHVAHLDQLYDTYGSCDEAVAALKD